MSLSWGKQKWHFGTYAGALAACITDQHKSPTGLWFSHKRAFCDVLPAYTDLSVHDNICAGTTS